MIGNYTIFYVVICKLIRTLFDELILFLLESIILELPTFEEPVKEKLNGKSISI